jgi:hypothetical protein
MMTRFAAFALAATLTAPTALADETLYTVEVSGDTKVQAGKDGKLTFTIVPAKDWKINEEFPTWKVSKAQGEGISVKSSGLKEKTQKQAKFDVVYTAAQPGKREMAVEMKIAVCKGKDVCVPATAKKTVAVDVVASK